MSFSDYSRIEDFFSNHESLEDQYDGLTLDDVLDDDEKEELRAYKAKEHVECSLSMDSLGISYRD